MIVYLHLQNTILKGHSRNHSYDLIIALTEIFDYPRLTFMMGVTIASKLQRWYLRFGTF